MRTILVATDFSPIADNAVEYAAAVAKQFEARLVLFNAFTLSVHAANSLVPASAFLELFNKNETRLKEKASLIASAYDIKVVHESKFSFIGEELKVLLDKYNVNIIVLG